MVRGRELVDADQEPVATRVGMELAQQAPLAPQLAVQRRLGRVAVRLGHVGAADPGVGHEVAEAVAPVPVDRPPAARERVPREDVEIRVVERRSLELPDNGAPLGDVRLDPPAGDDTRTRPRLALVEPDHVRCGRDRDDSDRGGELPRYQRRFPRGERPSCPTLLPFSAARLCRAVVQSRKKYGVVTTNVVIAAPTPAAMPRTDAPGTRRRSAIIPATTSTGSRVTRK